MPSKAIHTGKIYLEVQIVPLYLEVQSIVHYLFNIYGGSLPGYSKTLRLLKYNGTK